MAVVRAEKLSESLTQEQRAIVGTNVLPGETLKVEAAAGAGKSTVLRLYAERRPHLQTLYLTFTASEARAKQSDYARRGLYHVTVSTLHARAYAVTGDIHHGAVVAALDLTAVAVARVTETSSSEWPPLRRASLMRVLDCFTASDAPDIATSHAESTGCDASALVSAAQAVWRVACDPEDEMPLSHDMYLKLCTLTPELREAMFRDVDLVLLDEAHDCTEAQLMLVEARQGRTWGSVLVYDFHQRIYGWRRAATTRYLRALDALGVLPLSCSWRFGGALGRLAADLLVHHSSTATRVVGTTTKQTYIREVPCPPFSEVCGAGRCLTIVARTRHSLFGHAVEAVLSGAVERISFGSQDTHGTYDLFGGREALLDTFALSVGRGQHAMLLPASGAGRCTELGFAVYKAAVRAAGSYEAIEACAVVERYGSALPELMRKLDMARRSQSACQLILMSVHDSKGGEWSHVYVSHDLQRPGGRQDDPEEHEYRLNLLYVAMTRACAALFLPTPVVTSWLLAGVGRRVL